MKHFDFNLPQKKQARIAYPLHIGLIDLGTNSLRFDIYEISGWMKYQLVLREKWMVRLGDGVFERGVLDAASKQRCYEALASIQALRTEYQLLHIVAVGTATLRQASDAQEFVTAIQKQFDIDIQIISGTEEASFIAQGVLQNEITPRGTFVLIDIGGGSTEIILTENKQILDMLSLDLGANRLNQMFPLMTAKEFNPIQAQALQKHCYQEVLRHIEQRKWPAIPLAIGSSGTIRSIRRILKKRDITVDPFSLDDLIALSQNMLTLSSASLQNLPGLESRRADIILPGCLLLAEICRACGIGHIHASQYSLRDGLLRAVLQYVYYHQ